MKRSVMFRVLVACTLFCMCSCTVLEERSGCPCYLAVDLSKVDKSIREWQLWLFAGDGRLVFKDTIYRRSYTAPYVVQVPRNRQLQCFMWGNARGATILDEANSPSTLLLKKEGLPADSLFSYADTIDTWKEDGLMRVIPRKEFATIDIYIYGWAEIDFEAEMELVCDSRGFFVGGDFYPDKVSVQMQLKGIDDYYTHFSGRMLRQPDTENLRLSLMLKKKEIDGQTGQILVNQDIPIGRYLEENGYDMQSPQLQDIRMELDYSYTNITIRTDDWEASYEIEEEI